MGYSFCSVEEIKVEYFVCSRLRGIQTEAEKWTFSIDYLLLGLWLCFTKYKIQEWPSETFPLGTAWPYDALLGTSSEHEHRRCCIFDQILMKKEYFCWVILLNFVAFFKTDDTDGFSLGTKWYCSLSINRENTINMFKYSMVNGLYLYSLFLPSLKAKGVQSQSYSSMFIYKWQLSCRNLAPTYNHQDQ